MSQPQFTFVEQIFIGVCYELVALFRQRKQKWISQGLLLQAVQSLVLWEREQQCAVWGLKWGAHFLGGVGTQEGALSFSLKSCLHPCPRLSVRDTAKVMGAGGRRGGRVGTKAKKAVWARVQRTSKQLSTVECQTRRISTPDVALACSPGKMISEWKWVKVGDVECRGGKSLPGNRLAGTFEYVCQVAPGDAKGCRAAPRKTPLH